MIYGVKEERKAVSHVVLESGLWKRRVLKLESSS